jgi:hypothetical protein
MSKEPGDLVPLSRFRATLARPRGVRRMDALLESDDAAAAVAALSVPDFYFLVKEVGLGDADDLVALATPEQIRGCLDLEIWDRDRVELAPASPWLVSVLEAGPEKVAEVWAGLDAELRALFLARNALVIDHSLGEELPDDEDRPAFTTPDTFYTVVVTAEREDDVRLVYQLIDHLYRVDQELARHTLMSSRSELPAELEEMSYRWRSGRMADLGYADFYEALEVFRPLDPDSVRVDEATAEPREAMVGEEARAHGLPAPVAEPIAGTFLARALEQVTDAAESERIEAALIHLVNRVLSALRVRPGDEDGVRSATGAAAATLSIGLEHLCAGRVERAPAALAAVSLARLHRLGHSLVLRLGRMARLLAPRALTAGEPSQSLLEGLLRARPLFPTALDDPPGADLRPFRAMADLRRAASHLTDLAARIALADALGVDLLAMAQAPEPRPELDDHVRTALARRLAGGELDAAPLEPPELERLRQGPLAGGRLPHADRAAALRALVELAARNRIAVAGEVLARLVATWLDEIEAQVGGIIRSADKT